MMFANPPHHPSRLLAACVQVSCLLALSACAAKQELSNQLATSHEAVEQAKTAGAPETAPDDFNTASNKLDRATTAARKADNVAAMRLAQQAQADADLAHAKTGAAHAMTAAAELAKSNQALRAEIGRAEATSGK